GRAVAGVAGRVGGDGGTGGRDPAYLGLRATPREAHRGRPGRCPRPPASTPPPLMLTDDEAVAVMVALATAAASPGASSAAAKVRRVLPAALAGRISALLSTMDVTTPARQASAPAAESLLALADGARRHR